MVMNVDRRAANTLLIAHALAEPPAFDAERLAAARAKPATFGKGMFMGIDYATIERELYASFAVDGKFVVTDDPHRGSALTSAELERIVHEMRVRASPPPVHLTSPRPVGFRGVSTVRPLHPHVPVPQPLEYIMHVHVIDDRDDVAFAGEIRKLRGGNRG
jgi:hypothetical protein